MEFGYTASIDLNDVPVLSAEELTTSVVASVQAGRRVLALFGLPEEDGSGVGLFCLLADDATRTLAAMRTAPLAAFDSMTPQCPQVHLFERELFEQWQIRPEGHPWLKPVRYCPPEVGDAPRPGPAETQYYRILGSQVHEVAVGPVHAGIIEPGHFRFQCYGENVMHLEIQLGFQHRGIEKLIRNAPARRLLPLVECVAGDSSIAHVTACCTLIERLTGLSVSMRGQLLRRVALELERLANHTGDLGAIGGDTGFLPTSAWNGRIRGDFLNMTALLCGNRFGRGLLCPGGVLQDVDTELCQTIGKRLRAAYRDVRGAVDIMFASQSVLARLTGTGRVSRQAATDLGLVGMAARACGLPRDARVTFPVDDLPLGDMTPRTELSGDVLARARVRSAELNDAAATAGAALTHIPFTRPGEALGTSSIPALPANRCAVGIAEGWRGEVCHVGITGAKGTFRAYKIVDPSFHNWMGLAMALRDEQISDFPLCNKSFNLSYCGHDL
ncbi:MAG TPA: hydrogenase [Candidatus Avidesulfovibrio excrementigallinarum]|nr:hydrogenase [Candidatus Avidesulfovibrio excrementigallinarum]